MGVLETIEKLFFGRYLDEIARKDTKILNLKKEIELNYDRRVELDIRINKANNDLHSLREYFTGKTDNPDWLNPLRSPYKPRIYIVERGMTYMVEIEPRDIYATSPTLERCVDMMNWEELTLNEKLTDIWKFVIKHIVYRYDQLEGWEYPTTTFYRERGDCEDGTILFTTLCRIAGIPSDRVFNATGWVYDKQGNALYGHSFPIVKMEDDQWYIMETTLDVVPKKPILFKGSSYNTKFYKGVGGVSNWYHKGVIKDVSGQI